MSTSRKKAHFSPPMARGNGPALSLGDRVGGKMEAETCTTGKPKKSS